MKKKPKDVNNLSLIPVTLEAALERVRIQLQVALAVDGKPILGGH